MRFQNLLNRFKDNERGSIAIVFALSLVALIGITGLAVDASRAYSVSGRIGSVLDSAGLAGAKLLERDSASDNDIRDAAQAYFRVHADRKVLDGLEYRNFTTIIDRPNNKVVTRVEVKLPTLFAQVLGIPEFEFNRDSTVVLNTQKIELAMVLDITGSMNDNGKLPAMKAAATSLIDDLMSGSTTEDSIRIAVAPFSASVNAGALANRVSASPAVTTCGSSFDFDYRCRTTAGLDVDTCVIERVNSQAFTDAAPVGADILPAVPSTPYGNYSCPPSTVIPLLGKSQVNTLKSTINGYVALGATAGHIGTAWGWYLLSPNWASVLPSASAPKPYNQSDVSKYVIFLTDGIFNTSFKSGSATDPTTQMNESFSQFQSLCSAMKAKGITVYTIALDLLDSRALAELATCGGGNSYTAANGSELNAVFKNIVKQLNTLRVSG